jgi:hypothetical protein
MKYFFQEKMNHNYTDTVATYFFCIMCTARRANLSYRGVDTFWCLGWEIAVATPNGSYKI